MVESGEPGTISAGTMVLPMTRPPQLRGNTAYQLQPETMLNHSGMLPAAALSNFFKAPSSPIISSQLPTIHCGADKPQISKSIHQRNKCLAEVIQSQLMELKRLQGKHRLQKGDGTCTTGVYKSNVSKSLPINTDDQHVGTAYSSQYKKVLNTSSPRKLITPDIKVLMGKTGTAAENHQHPSTTTTTPVDTGSSVHRPDILLMTPTATQLQSISCVPRHDGSSGKNSQADNRNKADTNNGLSCNRSLTPVVTPNHSLISPLVSPSRSDTTSLSVPIRPAALQQNYMDPIKFATIRNWVEKVEMVQKLEGKCSDVISKPDPS